MGVRDGAETMRRAREAAAMPDEGCRRHRSHAQGCPRCALSFVDRVAWLLAHPDETKKPQDADRPKLDPTPCGVCGSVIGEGLMVMHMAVCPGRPNR